MVIETETQIVIPIKYPNHFRQIAISKQNGEFSVTNKKGRKVGVSPSECELALYVWRSIDHRKLGSDAYRNADIEMIIKELIKE